MIEMTKIAIRKNEETGRVEIVLPYKLMGQVDLKFTTDVIDSQEIETCECEDCKECEEFTDEDNSFVPIKHTVKLDEIKETKIREELEAMKLEILKSLVNEIQ